MNGPIIAQIVESKMKMVYNNKTCSVKVDGRFEIGSDINSIIPIPAASEQYIGNPLKASTTVSPNQIHNFSLVFLFTVKPQILSEPEDVTAASGQSVKLLCNVTGDPDPEVIWSKEDGVLPKKRVVRQNKFLTISQVTPDDEGIYVCDARNLVGSISVSISLAVHGKES